METANEDASPESDTSTAKSIERTRLAQTGFRRLWGGDFASNMGSAMVTFAVPVIGVTAIGLSATEVSWIVAASLSAPVLFALSAGVIADRVKRSLLLHLCNLGRLLIFAVLFWMLLAGSLDWVGLAVGLFVVGVLTLLYESSMLAAVTAIVPRTHLVKANSWIEGGVSVAETGGPVVAGAIISFLGSSAVLLFNVGTYAMSSLLLLGLPLDRKILEGETRDESSGLRGHLKEVRLGFILLWEQVPQRVVLLAATIYNFFDSWLLAIFSVFALTVLDLSPFVLGLIFVVPTVTGLIGSSLAFKLTERFRLGKLMTGSFALIAVSGLALILTTVVSGLGAAVVAAIVFAVFEFCIVVNMIIGRTMRQTLFPERHISKVMGTARFVSWGVDPIGALMGGAVAALFGLNVSIVIAASGFVFAAVVCVMSSQLRRFDGLSDGDRDAD